MKFDKPLNKETKTSHQTPYTVYPPKIGIRGALGVMVIVVENGHGDSSSNSGRGYLHLI